MRLAPLLGRRGRWVLQRGGSSRSRRGPVPGSGLRRSLLGGPGRFAPSSLRSTATPPPDVGTRLRRHGTAVPLRLSLAGSSRFAPGDKPLRSFVAAGQGSLTISGREGPNRRLLGRGHAGKAVAHFVRGTMGRPWTDGGVAGSWRRQPSAGPTPRCSQTAQRGLKSDAHFARQEQRSTRLNSPRAARRRVRR